MQQIDWIILIVTLLFIVFYGAWKTQGSKNVTHYILANKESSWKIVGLSVMATQASAITFLSTPGQAYHDGMGFVQFYFGLPIAMVVIAISFIPIYKKLKVFTAYEFLEKRFDLKIRSLAAILFLLPRGLGTGLTIYAPSIILSTLLGWDITMLNIVIGFLVIIYTFVGGTKALNVTQTQQIFVIIGGMGITFYLLLHYLPNDMSLANALQIAGANDKMNILDFSFDPETRYTFWTGIAGGFFLMLSYFGTDQSQVGRYLTGKSIEDSQKGLLMNGFLKVPMQFFILLTGVLVFVFYQFNPVPLNFNPNNKIIVENSKYKPDYNKLEIKLALLNEEKKEYNLLYIDHLNQGYDNPILRKKLISLSGKEKDLREQAKELITKADPKAETNDKDYVFLNFIVHHLPNGILGLLLAVIFSAAMSGTASGINALAATTTIDIYKRNLKSKKSDKHFVNATKLFILIWGLVAILFASFCNLFENLIQLVNLIGSIFYGTVLGVFLVGIYLKKIQSNPVFYAAIISQVSIFFIYYYTIYSYPVGQEKLSYLWLNFIGAFLTIIIATILQILQFKKPKSLFSPE